MKKVTDLLYITGLFIAMLPGAACKKMLSIPSNVPGQLVTGLVFSDSSTAVSGVVGMYTNGFGNDGPLSLYMSLYPALSSDEITSSFSSDFLNNALTAGSDAIPGGSTGNIWNSFYNNKLIYQANAAIEGIAASKALTASLKDQLTGECEMIRALSYFYLVNLFGPVPVATGTDYLVNGKLPRAPVDTVYAQIIRDLINAGNHLKETYPSVGRARPNKYTAMALLSRVYLYRKEWARAKALADAIINSGNYILETPDNVFVTGNQEAIWQAVSVGYFRYETSEGQTFVPNAPDIIPQYFLTTHLLDAFEPGDLRQLKWTGVNNVNGVDYFYPYKYKNRQAAQIDGRIEGEVLFRVAEQFLIRAEASIELGDLAGGAKDIDEIRGRAGLSPTTATSKDELLNAVVQERRTEFFCECGHRWLDLKRSGSINAAMSAAKGSLWPADGHAALYPIPYDQLRLNLSHGWQQNSGY